MKTYLHLLYLSEFPWNEKWFKQSWRQYKKNIMFNNFFSKILPFWDNVEKYGKARQVTDDNIIRRMQISCWINTTADRPLEYAILIAFIRQQ
jgi:hypothetical protein